MRKILIYGVGNPYRCDDSVGIKITDALRKRIKKANVTILSGSIDGIAILDEILGYDYVLFVDSMKSDRGIPGTIYKIPLFPLKETPELSVSHGIDFITALRLGKKLHYKMPKQIDIVAVEIEDNTSFTEECTKAVQEIIPTVVENIEKEIENMEDRARHGN